MFASRAIPANPVMFAGGGGGGDDFLTCRMCLVPFCHLTRLPLALNCLHTFCEHCVTSWMQNKSKSHKLTCPICKKVTKIEKGARPKDALPINRAVLELAAVTGPSPFYPAPQKNCMPFGIMPAGQFDLVPNNQLFNAGVVDQNCFVPVLKDSTNIGYKEQAGPCILVSNNGIQGFPLREEDVLPNEYPNLASLNNVCGADQGWVDSPNYALQKQKGKDSWEQMQNQLQQQLQQQQQQQRQQLLQLQQQQQQLQKQQQQQQCQTSSYCADSNLHPLPQLPSHPKDPGYKKFGRATPFTVASPQSVDEIVVKTHQPAPVKTEDRACTTKEFVSNVSIGDVRGPRSHAPMPCHEPAPQTTVTGQHQPLTFQVGSLARHGGTTAMQQPMMKSRGETEECHLTGANPIAGTAITALTVNSSPGISSFSGAVNTRNTEPQVAHAEQDLCTRCFKYPAQVSVASSKAMKAQRLCTSCHSEKKVDAHPVVSVGSGDCVVAPSASQLLNKDRNSPKPKVDANSATNMRKKTVIKVHDEKATALADRFQRDPCFNDTSDEWPQNVDSNANHDALPISTSVMKLDGPVRINANSRDIFLNQPKGGDCGRANEKHSPIPIQQSISDCSVPAKIIQEAAPPVHPTSTRIDLGDPPSRRVSDRQKYGVVGVRSKGEVISSGVGVRNMENKPAAATFLPREYVVNPTRPHPEKIDSGVQSNKEAKRLSNAIANAPELESEYETRRPDAYNPQFVESNVEWSLPQVVETAPQPDVQMAVAQTTKHQEAMSYEGGAASQASGGGGWNMTNSSAEKSGMYPPEMNGSSHQPGGMYPTLRAPPRYEEIMGTAPDAGLANIMQPIGGIVQANNAGGARSIGRFGKYGEVSTQPGALRAPTRLSFTPQLKPSASASTNATGDKIVVVDHANMTVQVKE